MKIRLQRPKFYDLIVDIADADSVADAVANAERSSDKTSNDETSNKKADSSVARTGKGRILTLWLVSGIVVCCLAWTLTVYLYCRKPGGGGGSNDDSGAGEANGYPLQCSSQPMEYR